MRIKLIISLILLNACQDVISIETPTESPRLIVDAIIRIDEDQPIFNATIKVSQTSSFFGVIPLTDLEQVTIINLDLPQDNVLVLLETSPGVYERETGVNFLSSGELLFQLTHQDRLYLAQTSYAPTGVIDSIYQGNNILFDKDDTEFIVSFSDNPDKDNYYIFEFGEGEFSTTNDQFYQGQQFEFSYFSDRKLDRGDEVTVSMLGANKDFHDYMSLLIEQAEENPSPFDTPVATVRGNIFDVTDIDNIDAFDNVESPDNFPLGYFAVIQTRSRTITIE